MASRSPPSDLSTYQIHIPLPSNGVPLGSGVVVVWSGGGLTTRIGPYEFDLRPKRSTARMRPEPAAGGTTTTSPARLLRSFELISLRLLVLRGKRMSWPLVRPAPRRTSLPPGAT